MDYTPIDGKPMDLQRIAEIGNKGVLLLMSDSTNVQRPGHTMSERSVGREFDKIFMNCNKRIIVATFASNIHRIQQIIDAAAIDSDLLSPLIILSLGTSKSLNFIASISTYSGLISKLFIA